MAFPIGSFASLRYCVISLIVTAKLNDINPQAGLVDVLARIVDHAAGRLNELLPWKTSTALGRAA